MLRSYFAYFRFLFLSLQEIASFFRIFEEKLIHQKKKHARLGKKGKMQSYSKRISLEGALLFLLLFS